MNKTMEQHFFFLAGFLSKEDVSANIKRLDKVKAVFDVARGESVYYRMAIYGEYTKELGEFFGTDSEHWIWSGVRIYEDLRNFYNEVYNI